MGMKILTDIFILVKEERRTRVQFSNIDPKLADQIQITNSYTDYIQNHLPNSLVMEETTFAEIINIVQNIKLKWI